MRDAEPFDGPIDHFNTLLGELKLQILRFMQVRGTRLISRDGTYTELSVSPQEVSQSLLNVETNDTDSLMELLHVPSLERIEAALASVRERTSRRLAASAEAGVHLPLEELRAGFMLNETEFALFFAAIAPRLSIPISRMYTVAWADFTMRQPTAGFLAEVISRDDREVQEAMNLLSDASPLIRFRLMVPTESERWKPTTPRIHAPIDVSERIVDFDCGRDAMTSLSGCTLHHEGLPREDLVLAKETHKNLRTLMRKRRPRIALVGPKHAGRRTVVCSLASDVDCPVMEVDLQRAIVATTSREALIELAGVLRETRLHGAWLLLRADEIGSGTIRDLLIAQQPSVEALLANFPGPIFFTSTTGGAALKDLFGDIPEIVLPTPNIEGQAKLWLRALNESFTAEDRDSAAESLSQTYRLTPGSVFRAVEGAFEIAEARGARRKITLPDVLSAVRRQLDHGLGGIADAISVNMTMDRIVLSEDMRSQVDEILIYARNSSKVFHKWRFIDRSPTGLGLSVMFSGPPGTGKTLMAGVLARELGRMLYRVDLSRIVDKFIGETEKNLGRVFDEAERAQAILLFDEADSLFAKRTKVKSSNDRYANLEVNYLLQRLDSFEGVSILTTNFVTSIDEAFQRRIRFKIEFPMPDPAMRARIWQNLLPPGAPIAEDINWLHLGTEHEFSGGHIRNAILRAAVNAAEADIPIDETLLMEAGAAESREMGQLVRR